MPVDKASRLHLSGAPESALPTNFTLDWKALPGTNSPAYYGLFSLAPGWRGLLGTNTPAYLVYRIDT
jgi:hypothetical protein